MCLLIGALAALILLKSNALCHPQVPFAHLEYPREELAGQALGTGSKDKEWKHQVNSDKFEQLTHAGTEIETQKHLEEGRVIAREALGRVVRFGEGGVGQRLEGGRGVMCAHEG